MFIGGLQKSSLIDYPEKISAIIFTQGCNFRCPYCHNPEIIKMDSATALAVAPILEFLKSRVGKLDGVVITGGEPTLQKDLPELIRSIKEMGFLVKLDTNGTNPQMLQNLIDEKIIDYVAMDIKAPIERYSEVVRIGVNTENILKSIEILKTSEIEHEFRTTVVSSQLCIEDFKKIAKIIEGSRYYLQKFLPTKTLSKAFMVEKTYSDEDFKKIISEIKPYFEHIELR